MKLGDIAAALERRCEGDGEVEISGVAGMEHAGPGNLTFLANPKYAPKVKHTKASAILVTERPAGVEIACILSDNPYLDFARALALFYQPPRTMPGIHPRAVVADSAEIGENCSIGPYAVVGERVRMQHSIASDAHAFA